MKAKNAKNRGFSLACSSLMSVDRHRAGRLSPPGHCAMPLFILSSVIAIACNHAPDEPHADPLPAVTATATATATASATVAATATPPAKCVVPLSSAAPAVPAAAGARCPPDAQGRFKLARARVSFPDAGVSVDAELARSDAENERGLMFRKQMGEDEGMFFFLEDRRVQTFWMHNTCIPLDMIFIDEDGTIVGIVESAPVLDDGPRQVDCPSRFVLEVNAGWSRRHHVKPGQHVIVPS